MPKRDKNREMEGRLARIERGLAIFQSASSQSASFQSSQLDYAIRQLGDGLDVFKFDPTKKVETLSLYQAAINLDANRGVRGIGHAEKLEGLYGQVVSAFEAYQKEKAGEATIATLAEQAPVDDTIERIFHYSDFSCIYRTQETRWLDKQYKERLADTHRGLQLVTSTLMHVFVNIANETGYFAGIRVNELRILATAPSLEQHVMNGFVALKTCREDKMEIAVPVRLDPNRV